MTSGTSAGRIPHRTTAVGAWPGGGASTWSPNNEQLPGSGSKQHQTLDTTYTFCLNAVVRPNELPPIFVPPAMLVLQGQGQGRQTGRPVAPVD
jgi:hypothetical protein